MNDALHLPIGNKQRGNCFITSAATFFEIPFNSVWDYVKKASSKGGNWKGSTPNWVIPQTLKHFGFDGEYERVSNMTVEQWVSTRSELGTKYLVLSTGHAQVVLDGEVLDQQGPIRIAEYWGKRKKINGFYAMRDDKQTKVTLIENRKETKTMNMQVEYIDVSEIQIDGDFNARLNTPTFKSHVRDLAANMRERGYDNTKPLVINGNNVIVDGHCRFKALTQANKDGSGITTVPVFKRDYDSDTDKVYELLNQNNGEQLTMLERGQVGKRLLAAGETKKDIAAKAQVTPAAMGQAIKVADCPTNLRIDMETGTITESETAKDGRCIHDFIIMEMAGSQKVYEYLVEAEKAQRKSEEIGERASLSDDSMVKVYKKVLKKLTPKIVPDDPNDGDDENDGEGDGDEPESNSQKKLRLLFEAIEEKATQVDNDQLDGNGEPMKVLTFWAGDWDNLKDVFGQ